MRKPEGNWDQLEAMIDQTSLSDILGAIAHICCEKADHVRSNWQDEQLAKVWEFNARQVANAQAKVRRTC